MTEDHLVLVSDIGTTGSKTCLYRIGKTLELVQSHLVEYPLFMIKDGGAEQHVEDWWSAICQSVRAILAKTGIDPGQIEGLAFSSQMQGSILVDKTGRILRHPMIFLDGRAVDQINKYLRRGWPKIAGMNALKVLRTLRITGGVAATPKDPLWKYHWVRENEPDIFRQTDKWLDVKDYLVLRCTGNYGMTQDSAHLTFLFDTRPGKLTWHTRLCRSYGVDPDHLPPVFKSTDQIGGLTREAADQMGLNPGLPVFGGGGDASLTTVGSGSVGLNDIHFYIGTSGWVISNVDKRLVDIGNFTASILGAIPGYYNYIAEQETSGACLQWVRDHLALDEIGIYLAQREDVPGDDTAKLYDLLNQAVAETPPGAGRVLFTPWLHGNRSPREDAYARGMFFNIGLDTGKRDLIRAVLEGVAFHKRWMLEAIEKKVPFQDTIRLVGGGALSETWCQIIADVTGRTIETVENPQDIGTAGAAIVCGVGMGVIPSFETAKSLIRVKAVFHPQSDCRNLYNNLFQTFIGLYDQNKKLLKQINTF